MSDHLLTLLLPAGAYLLGAVPCALLIGLALGVDLRTAGSGNAGAGNLVRTAGVFPGGVAAVLDGLKGLVPVLAARGLGLGAGMAAVCGLAAIAGHNWSVYLGGRSGRGLATSAGAAVALDPILIIWSGGWAVAGWKLGGGLGGFIGWGLAPVFAMIMAKSHVVVLAAAGMSLLMIIRRMQGNPERLAGVGAAFRRAIWDTDQPEDDVSPADEPALP